MNERTASVRFKNAKGEIEWYGFRQSLFVRGWPVIYGGIVSLIALALVSAARWVEGAEAATRVLPTVVALSALVLGFQQWRANRIETSMDKFYERLDRADLRLEGWSHARAVVAHLWEGQSGQEAYERTNYFYVELDNLEYVIEKYKLGYVNWLRLFIWLIIGLVIYFSYGRYHSRVRNADSGK